MLAHLHAARSHTRGEGRPQGGVVELDARRLEVGLGHLDLLLGFFDPHPQGLVIEPGENIPLLDPGPLRNEICDLGAGAPQPGRLDLRCRLKYTLRMHLWFL